MEEYSIEKTFTSNSFISIIIVGRNEANRITRCLTSITQNDFPKNKYEIIFVDDHSSDNTIALAQSLSISNLRILRLADYIKENNLINSFKKYAQRIAASEAQGELLLFTDADVVVPTHWISVMSSFLEAKSMNVATGLIRYEQGSSILDKFQAMDVAGTMIMTAAGIYTKKTFLANGANMIVRKKTYLNYLKEERDGYASGDDVLLIQSVAYKDNTKVGFVKSNSAMVTTYPQKSWRSFINQRLRWAGKTTSYSNKRLTVTIAIIFFFNMVILVNLFLSLIFGQVYLLVFLFLFVIKVGVESLYLKSGILYFDIKSPLRALPFSMIVYSALNVLYIVFIGIMGLFRTKYVWKERRTR